MSLDEPFEERSGQAAGDTAEASLWLDLKTQGSVAAREQLFTLYLPYARQVARRHYFDRTVGDLEMSDLVQLACAGLLEAIDHFDPDFGAPFRGFAARRISGSVLDGLAKMTEVREQISHRSRQRRDRARSLIGGSAQAKPGRDALQALTELAVGLALGFMLEGTGLYQGDEASEPKANAYESLAWKETVGRLAGEVANLPEREQAVVRRHYVDGLTFDQIGALLGVSRGRISQLHRAALERLRKRLSRSDDFRLER